MKAVYRSVDDMKPCPGSGVKPERESVCPVCQHWFKHARFTRVTPTHRRWLPENVETSSECGHSRGELRADQECEIDRAPENVECQTCRGGREWWTAVQANPCPDCGGAGFQASGICDYCGSGGINPEYVIENCPKCSTPENVECQTCNDFRQVFASRDVERPESDRWYACPDCTTPENVEEPT